MVESLGSRNPPPSPPPGLYGSYFPWMENQERKIEEKTTTSGSWKVSTFIDILDHWSKEF